MAIAQLCSSPLRDTTIYISHLFQLHSGQDKLARSSSIDSMVDVVWNNDNDTNLPLPKHLMVQEATSSRRESMLSPRRTKQTRGINCKLIVGSFVE